MPVIPYDIEWLKRHGYDAALVGIDDRDLRWLAAVKEKRESRTRSRGVGDTIQKMTKAVGIPACGGCAKRQAALNKLLPYRT